MHENKLAWIVIHTRHWLGFHVFTTCLIIMIETINISLLKFHLETSGLHTDEVFVLNNYRH